MNWITLLLRRYRRVGALWIGVVVWAAVSQAASLQVVATTGMVGDLVARVGGDRVEVEYLMGAGVDPHLYKATASDVRKLQRADVVFYNGLLLEGKMQGIFERMERDGRLVVPVTSGLDHDRLLHPANATGHPDPHIWFDVEMWGGCVGIVVQTLSEADPVSAPYFAEQGRRVSHEMGILHEWAVAKSVELPPARRILVTSHDAYGYFGRAYGFQVVGLQGISTVSEAALADMAQLVDYIRDHAIKAIFVESSVPHSTIERIATDAKVAVGGELFSDAMGTPGQMENGYDLGTYEGMVRHNLTTIVEALR